jgi:pilus assembly protein CpaF
VSSRFNLLISGGAGSGKTTLLNALCGALPLQERIVSIEDAAELRLSGIHAVSMEARPSNVEGLGEVTIRQLVRNALRMRPDRLVIGEIRDAAAFEFLQAINTGHAGSMCTVHANTAADAIYRLENLALMAAGNVVLTAIRDQMASALDLVIHLARSSGGVRRLSEIGILSLPGTPLSTLTLFPAGGADSATALDLLLARARRRSGEGHASRIVLTAKNLVGNVPHGL